MIWREGLRQGQLRNEGTDFAAQKISIYHFD